MPCPRMPAGVLLCCAALSCAGAEVRVGEPDVDRTELHARIDEVLGAGREEGPGVAVLVLRDGAVLAERSYGYASLELGVRFTADHVAPLPYSEGREFLAIAAALMEDDGLLRLGSPVRSYFPDLPSWAEPVTVRDLVFHRSGLVDEWSALLLMHSSMANRFERDEFLRLLRDQPLPETEPHTGYLYSNSDYGLLRLILEQAAGEDLGSYLARRVFSPLGMSATTLLDDPSAALPGLARMYAPAGRGYRIQPVKTSPGGDYVIATTANDLVRWAAAMDDPYSDVARAVARLREGETPIPGLPGHYAFGQSFDEVAGHPVVRHEGVLGCNYLTRVPDLDLAVITFGNRFYEPAENHALVAFLLGAQEEAERLRFPREAVAVDSARLEGRAGSYVSVGVPSWQSETSARDLATVELVDGALVLQLSWGRFPLVPTGPSTFTWHSDASDSAWALQVDFPEPGAGDGAPMVLRWDDGFVERFAAPPDWDPPGAWTAGLAGRYTSAHLDYTWAIRADAEGDLRIHAPTLPDLLLTPWAPGEFLVRHEKFPGMPSNFWVRFHEGADGRVTHLTVEHERTRGFVFERE